MSGYNAKNYTEQGGSVTHIGGELVFEEGAQVSGLPSSSGGSNVENQAASFGSIAENQAASSATLVATLKNDFNALLAKLKNAGIMEPDTWTISVRLAPALTDAAAAANNAKASAAYADGVITITADVGALEGTEISGHEQGQHKWIGLGVGTGLSSVELVKLNGSAMTLSDAEEATAVGLDYPGEFVLYVCAEEIAETPKSITLKADGYNEITISITLAATAAG